MSDSINFNEAQLRGINLEELKHESFTDTRHSRMVRNHEAKAKLWYGWKRMEQHRPEPSPEKSQPVAKLKQMSKVSFTDAQLKIAANALRKK